jgi:hypothetical protein
MATLFKNSVYSQLVTVYLLILYSYDTDPYPSELLLLLISEILIKFGRLSSLFIDANLNPISSLAFNIFEESLEKDCDAKFELFQDPPLAIR